MPVVPAYSVGNRVQQLPVRSVKHKGLNSGEKEDQVYETLRCLCFREILCIIVVNYHLFYIYCFTIVKSFCLCSPPEDGFPFIRPGSL